MNRNTARPAIQIFRETDADSEKLMEICSGIEEEGVPYSVIDLPAGYEPVTGSEKTESAGSAANVPDPGGLTARNPLETCILLYRGRAELFFRRLKSRPLFRVCFNEGAESDGNRRGSDGNHDGLCGSPDDGTPVLKNCRTLGKNAARLVKSRPFFI